MSTAARTLYDFPSVHQVEIFLSSLVVPEAGSRISKIKLYDAWADYCHELGAYVGSRVSFARAVDANGLREVRDRHTRYWVDVAFVEKVSPAASAPRLTAVPSLEVADRLMTCPACARVFQVDENRTLPLHQRALDEFFEVEESGTCPGSYTQAQPHRMLPEGRGLTFIQFVDGSHAGNVNDEHLDLNARVAFDSINFLCKWIGPQGMPTDQSTLVRVAGHANNLQQAALNLLDEAAMQRPNGQRRRM